MTDKERKLQERIQMLEQLIRTEKQKRMKKGVIYGMVNKKYGTIDYVGYTTNIDPNDRLTSHKQDMKSSTRVPFYKLLL